MNLNYEVALGNGRKEKMNLMLLMTDVPRWASHYKQEVQVEVQRHHETCRYEPQSSEKPTDTSRRKPTILQLLGSV